MLSRLSHMMNRQTSGQKYKSLGDASDDEMMDGAAHSAPPDAVVPQVQRTDHLFSQVVGNKATLTFSDSDGTICTAGPFFASEVDSTVILNAPRRGSSDPSTAWGSISVERSADDSSSKVAATCSLFRRFQHSKIPTPFSEQREFCLASTSASEDGGNTWTVQVPNPDSLTLRDPAAENFRSCTTIQFTVSAGDDSDEE